MLPKPPVSCVSMFVRRALRYHVLVSVASIVDWPNVAGGVETRSRRRSASLPRSARVHLDALSCAPGEECCVPGTAPSSSRPCVLVPARDSIVTTSSAIGAD